MEPEEEVNRRMEKLNIRAGEKQLNQALERQMVDEDVTFTKSERALVYKKISDMTRKKKNQQKWVKFDQLWS